MKNLGSSSATLLMVLTVFLQGCAHTEAEKRIDEKLTREDKVSNIDELRSQATQLIESTPGINQKQRSKLAALRESIRKENDETSAQSLKLRSILIKDLISSKYDEEEVSLIKDRIKKLEEKRLSALFDAVEQANVILEHTPEREQMVRELFWETK